MRCVEQSSVHEWSFRTEGAYENPFNDVYFDAVFVGPAGESLRVPAFWAGGDIWKVRFSTRQVGTWNFRTECSEHDDADLHDQSERFEVVPAKPTCNPLIEHGPVEVATDRRHFQHADGEPFLWLGDTWWMGLTHRLPWETFCRLAMQRAREGFSVVQIVAGLYPDMPPLDPRGVNEAGLPWEDDFARINPAYFDQADRRIECLVNEGIAPLIVACWGYFLDFMGPEKVKQHWRYLIARWGALPVLWCLAGEVTMPYYLNPLFNDRSKYEPPIRAGWTDVARYVRQTDPYSRPLTAHGIFEQSSRQMVDDPSVVDFDLLQAGSGGYVSVPGAVKLIHRTVRQEPPIPVVQGEVVYEGLADCNDPHVERLVFWATMLSGAAGYTYGANGLWQANHPGQPHGASPYGLAYAGLPAEDAANQPGARQLALGKRLLEGLDWMRFEPHPEWVQFGDPPGVFTRDAKQAWVPYAAGIPGEFRLIYFGVVPYLAPLTRLTGLEPGKRYRSVLICPRTGCEHDYGLIEGDENGEFRRPPEGPMFQDLAVVPPAYSDWLLLMQSE